MRINKFIAQATGISRRAADAAIAEGRVMINGRPAQAGSDVIDSDTVLLDGKPLAAQDMQTIMFNKPVGYVVSRDGQGSATIYDLLPPELHHLKPVGRLDKDSSGLLLLSNDGDLANQLTHPSQQKRKVYEVRLDKPLQPLHRQIIAEKGLQLEDGPSQLGLERQHDGNDKDWIVSMHEGRNRQIRRTFAALGYSVSKLHRIQFAQWSLGNLPDGEYEKI